MKKISAVIFRTVFGLAALLSFASALFAETATYLPFEGNAQFVSPWAFGGNIQYVVPVIPVAINPYSAQSAFAFDSRYVLYNQEIQPMNIDRLASAIETSDEFRRFFSTSQRLQILRTDALLQEFLRERFADNSIAAYTGLSSEYRLWIFNTILENGERLDASVAIPNFKLLPSVQTQKWNAIWARSFAPYYSQMNAPGAAGLGYVNPLKRQTAVVRRTASRRSRQIDAVKTGTYISLLGRSGDWFKVNTESGRVGYIHKSDIDLVQGHQVLPWTGAGSVTLWQNNFSAGTENRTEVQYQPGYYSNSGWVYPWQTQRF